MNEWAERQGKKGDRQVIDHMLAHVPKEKVEGAYNRAAYMSRRREIARIWATMLSDGLPEPAVLTERSPKETGVLFRPHILKPVPAAFRFPVRPSPGFSPRLTGSPQLNLYRPSYLSPPYPPTLYPHHKQPFKRSPG